LATSLAIGRRKALWQDGYFLAQFDESGLAAGSIGSPEETVCQCHFCAHYEKKEWILKRDGEEELGIECVK
jgi:hypothetical protein